MLVCCKIGPLTMDPESGRSIHRKERKERIGKELRTSKASPGRGASFGFNNLVSSCLWVLCVLCGEFNFCFLIEAFAIRSAVAQSLLEKGFASSCIHTEPSFLFLFDLHQHQRVRHPAFATFRRIVHHVAVNPARRRTSSVQAHRFVTA